MSYIPQQTNMASMNIGMVDFPFLMDLYGWWLRFFQLIWQNGCEESMRFIIFNWCQIGRVSAINMLDPMGFRKTEWFSGGCNLHEVELKKKLVAPLPMFSSKVAHSESNQWQVCFHFLGPRFIEQAFGELNCLLCPHLINEASFSTRI